MTENLVAAKDSYEDAARKGSWDPGSTLHSGDPEIIKEFFEGAGPGKVIVDVGCWDGSLAKFALEILMTNAATSAVEQEYPWIRYIGIDISPTAVARFNGRGIQKAVAREADARCLPVEDDSADIVLCLFVLQDLDRDDGIKTLRELRRVAKANADILIGLTVRENTEEKKPYVLKEWRKLGVPQKCTYHWKLSDFKQVLRKEGLKFGKSGWHQNPPNEFGYLQLYVEAQARKGDTAIMFDTKYLPKDLPEEYEEAPDKSEIRPLFSTSGGGLAHCTLPPQGASMAFSHKTVEEIWYFIQGQGQVWRKKGDREEVVDVGPGTCITISTGTSFQFRNTGKDPLDFIIVTMPPWPGEEEAVRVQNHWKPKGE